MSWINLYGVILSLAIAAGMVSSLLALYGRYRALPRVLVGVETCPTQEGGCQPLFQTKAASLWGLPNAFFGVLYYLLLVVGLAAGGSIGLLFLGATVAFAMTVYLAGYLLRNHLECRICWVGHVANTAIWLLFLARWLSESYGGAVWPS
jgi:uncharacterized membrane protein